MNRDRSYYLPGISASTRVPILRTGSVWVVRQCMQRGLVAATILAVWLLPVAIPAATDPYRLLLEAEVSQGFRLGLFLTLGGTPASKVALDPKLTLRFAVCCGVASMLSPASSSRDSRGAGSSNLDRVAGSFP